ncbi:MAG: TatD family hydrolase [Candidatus Nanoarchaeia archaeon]
MYIDLHCHLDILEDIPLVIENARKAGLKKIVTTGICKDSNRKALKLAKEHDIVEASVGVYPWDALEFEKGEPLEFDIDEEIEFIRENKDRVIAIGEIGLDYKNGSPDNGQKKQFRKLLQLAKELDKPVIIHSRKAEEDAIQILEEEKMRKVVMHCFSGKKRLMKRARDNDWYFTVPTSVVRAEQFQIMVKEVSLSRLFCETDSPFLSPFKKHWNEPTFVVESYKKIAEIKEMELNEVKNNIFLNWQRLF